MIEHWHHKCDNGRKVEIIDVIPNMKCPYCGEIRNE